MSQFASLLQEEEARIAQRAENLQRRSSQVQFDLAAAAALQVQRQQDDAEEKDGDEQKVGEEEKNCCTVLQNVPEKFCCTYNFFLSFLPTQSVYQTMLH